MTERRASVMRGKNGELSFGFSVAYWILIASIVCGVATLQGFLAWQNQRGLIELQSAQTCNAVFNAVERGWAEVRLFTETVSGSFFADLLDISQEKYARLAQTKSLQSISALESLQFVQHIEGTAARTAWEAKVIDEFRGTQLIDDLVNDYALSNFGFNYTSVDNFFMYTFGFAEVGETAASGKAVWDPIIYQTTWDNWLWGFFPDPEPPRVAAIEAAIDAGELACSGRIDLFGHELNPAGLVCFAPLYKDHTTGEPVPSRQADSTSADIFGFVNPLFKVSKALRNIFESEFFDTDISDVIVYVYDTTPKEGPNHITGNVADSFMGRFPVTTKEEFDKIQAMVAEKLLAEQDFVESQSKKVEVGKREWTVYCGVKQSFYDKKASSLPYLLGLLSVAITVTITIIRVVVKKLFLQAQTKVMVYKEKSKSKLNINANQPMA